MSADGDMGDTSGGSARPAEGSDGAGVLGNLPRSRPSVRSPRRDAEARKAAAKPRRKGAPPAAQEPPEQRSSQEELEALARSGLAIAGGAASIGLRLAGRAASAVRGAVERR